MKSRIAGLFLFILAGCESVNYLPPVTSKIAGNGRDAGSTLATLNKGRNLFVHRCIECHTLPQWWHYRREDWPPIVHDMSHRASMTPEERDAVIAYLLAVRSVKE